MEENVFNRSALDLVGDFNEGGVFSDWLWPQQKEKRQMFEQMFMDQVEPLAKLKGLEAAGINPLTVAGETAKQPSSLPQPASSTNPIGDIAGVVGAVAGGVQSLATAKTILAKLPDEIEGIRATAAKDFAEAGLDNATTQGVLTDNTYKDSDWQSTLNIKRQQFENMKAEYQNILKNHDLLIEQINETISQTKLNGSLKDYNDALKLMVQENLRWQKELNDFRINNKLFITDSGIDGYIYSQVISGADLSSIDKFVDIYSSYRGRVQSAVSDAEYESELKTAYDRAHAYAKGQYNADPYQEQVRSVYDQLDELYDVYEETKKVRQSYIDAYEAGKIGPDVYEYHVGELDKMIEEQENGIKELNKIFSRERSKFGHRSMLEDMIKDGVAVGMNSFFNRRGVFQSAPTQVRGFSR